MQDIPLYLKTKKDMPRPADPEYYLVVRDRTYLCRNHPFFQTDVPVDRPVRSLAWHEPSCKVTYPKLGVAALEYIVGFFSKIFELHCSESIVLLYWDQERERYRLEVPPQEATVWESSSGSRSPMDVRYEVPPPPRRHLLAASIHCHGDIGAYSSATDKHDEVYRDGVHAIVGYVDREPPTFHVELAVDGHRFPLDFHDIFKGYKKRRKIVPEEWIKQVKVKVDRPRYISFQSKGYGSYSDYWSNQNKNKRSSD